MSLSLAEALGQVEFEPGRVYRCHVNGNWIELRVLEPQEPPPVPSSPFDGSDIMLDPWVELPQPTSGIRLRTRSGSVPLPDVPEIPIDDELA
jgi:hypothetical protein